MKHILPIIPILLLGLAFASCHHGERQTLRSALQMAYADPDSALTMLHTSTAVRSRLRRRHATP